MSSVIELVETLTKRLPELEYQLDEIGKIQSMALPKGLFRASQFSETMTSLACIEEIRSDLAHLKSLLENAAEQTSPLVLYIAKQVSLKMQVLLQLCHQHRRKKIASAKVNVEMKQLVTRQQWLESVHQEHQRLLMQQSALQCALEQHQDNTHAISTLQHALTDVATQLLSIKQLLLTLSGA